jgi:hypothetical protein
MAKIASFAEDTAAKSGKSARSVRLDATPRPSSWPDLDRIAGTSLDKGAELALSLRCRRRNGRPSSIARPALQSVPPKVNAEP